MKQIEKIYYLIREYQNGYYTTLYYEKDDSISSELFDVLDNYAAFFSRFSPFDEDVKSGVLFGEERIKSEFLKMLDVLSGFK